MKLGRPRKGLRGGLVLTLGNTGVAACSFIRNVVIARLIEPEDFGVAMTFSLAVTMIEMISNMAVDRFMIQAKDGNNRRLQASIQTLQLMLGVIGAVVLFALAGPIASIFNIPQHEWAFQLLALVPLIRGFAHLDRSRFQRTLNYGVQVASEFGGLFVSTLIAIPVGLYFQDYRVMLCVLFVQFGAFVVISHVLGRRPYQLGWHTQYVNRAFRFGWPLFLNGMLMFGTYQSDRFMVGTMFGMRELGWFAAAFGLTLVTSLTAGKILQSFFLPRLSRAQNSPDRFEKNSILLLQTAILVALVITTGFLIAGPALVVGIYGAKYAEAANIVGLLGLTQGIRTIRAAPTVIAMSLADTQNALISNIVRVIGWPVAFLFLVYGYSIEVMIYCGIGAELCATVVAFLLIRKKSNAVTKIRFMVWVLLIGSVVLAFVCADLELFNRGQLFLSLLFGTAFAVFGALICLAAMPEVRAWIYTRK